MIGIWSHYRVSVTFSCCNSLYYAAGCINNGGETFGTRYMGTYDADEEKYQEVTRIVISYSRRGQRHGPFITFRAWNTMKSMCSRISSLWWLCRFHLGVSFFHLCVLVLLFWIIFLWEIIANPRGLRHYLNHRLFWQRSALPRARKRWKTKAPYGIHNNNQHHLIQRPGTPDQWMSKWY